MLIIFAGADLQGKTASISVDTGANIMKLHNGRCDGAGDLLMGKSGVHFFDNSIVLKRSEVVFLSLPNSDIIEATVDEFLKEDVRGKIIVDTSTAFPVSTRALHKKLKEVGTLVAVAAGDREDVESMHELLMSYCTKYDYVGVGGNGHLFSHAGETMYDYVKERK